MNCALTRPLSPTAERTSPLGVVLYDLGQCVGGCAESGYIAAGLYRLGTGSSRCGPRNRCGNFPGFNGFAFARPGWNSNCPANGLDPGDRPIGLCCCFSSQRDCGDP